MKTLIILFLAGVFSMFIGIFGSRRILAPLVIAALIAAFGCLIYDWQASEDVVFAGMMNFNHSALAFTGIAVIATLFLIVLSEYAFRDLKDTLGDHYGLLLFSLCGAATMFASSNLLMLFLGIEILSIPLYVLAGSRRDDLSSNEAALKYFLMGAFATGILLFGMALLYGGTGTFVLSDIAYGANELTHTGDHRIFFNLGLLFVMIGLSFKIGAAPFHFWSPDVYEGSPSLITAFMATVVKTAGFAALFLVMGTMAKISDSWVLPLAVISALSMTIGNVTALFQSRVKRMLAYSSISHAGYMLMAILAITQGDYAGAEGALLLYLLAYSVATICIFAGYIIVSEQTGRNDFDAFNGLAKKSPLMAFSIALCLISLAGIPPTAGFFGKYLLFTQAFTAYPWLVVVAVINSAISIYYYFRLIVAMYFNPSTENTMPFNVPIGFSIVMISAVIILLGLIAMPEWFSTLL